MSTRAAATPTGHPSREPNEDVAAPPRRRASALTTAAAQVAAAAATSLAAVAWLTEAGVETALWLALPVGVAAALAAAWSVPPRERGRPVLVRRSRIGHAAGAALAIAVALAAAGQASVDGLSVLDALLVAAAAVLVAGGAQSALARMARPRRALIVGTGEVAHHLGRSLGDGRRGFEVVGVVDDDRLPAREPGPGAAHLGGITGMERLVAEHGVDIVIFSFVGAPDRELRQAVRAARAAGAEVAVVSRLFEGLQGSLSLRRLEGLPVVIAGPEGPSRGDEIARRATDLALAGLLLAVTFPLWLGLAIAIRVDSPGPVLYRARRIGRGERPFDMLKFRKMHDGAGGPALTVDDDERFTRMGRFLAHSKLDELPQLWNVVRGEMSLVGPRPEDERFVRAHARAYRQVLRARPGITGLSQIRYRREFEHLVGEDFEAYYTETLLPDKLAIDRYYVEHRSWVLDVRVLLWTAVALLRGGELHLSTLASHVAFRRSRGPDSPGPEARRAGRAA